MVAHVAMIFGMLDPTVLGWAPTHQMPGGGDHARHGHVSRRRVTTDRATPERLTRRGMLLGGLGLTGIGALAACAGPADPTGMAMGAPIGPVPSASPTRGQRLTRATLVPQETTLDLGGTVVDTWAYGDAAPGPTIRATAGDFLRVTVDNRLPSETSVHWHGIRLRNAADGVPGVTQDPIAAGATYVYEFTAPDPGTYFFHPHTGVQLDRGLYAPLIIDDPHEPGGYDDEWVVVLDDWLDGTGTTPDDVLAGLLEDGGSTPGAMGGMDHGSMNGMDMGGMGMGDPPVRRRRRRGPTRTSSSTAGLRPTRSPSPPSPVSASASG